MKGKNYTQGTKRIRSEMKNVAFNSINRRMLKAVWNNCWSMKMNLLWEFRFLFFAHKVSKSRL